MINGMETKDVIVVNVVNVINALNNYWKQITKI